MTSAPSARLTAAASAGELPHLTVDQVNAIFSLSLVHVLLEFPLELRTMAGLVAR